MHLVGARVKGCAYILKDLSLLALTLSAKLFNELTFESDMQMTIFKSYAVLAAFIEGCNHMKAVKPRRRQSYFVYVRVHCVFYYRR